MGFWALFIISNVPSQMTSEERVRKIQYWWSVATQIWVVLLIIRAAWEIWFNQSEELPRSGWWRVISMEFLRSFLRRHLAGKPVEASLNVGCFLRLNKQITTRSFNLKVSAGVRVGWKYGEYSLKMRRRLGWVSLFQNEKYVISVYLWCIKGEAFRVNFYGAIRW